MIHGPAYIVTSASYIQCKDAVSHMVQFAQQQNVSNAAPKHIHGKYYTHTLHHCRLSTLCEICENTFAEYEKHCKHDYKGL